MCLSFSGSVAAGSCPAVVRDKSDHVYKFGTFGIGVGRS